MSVVSLIHWTGAGHPDKLYAARLLAYTKNTRLNMTPEGFDSFFKDWSEEKILKEMNYMASTIPSSWEFIDVVFSINNVTRACAQQITRTRNASYAMQSQRVTDVGSATYKIPVVKEELAPLVERAYERAMNDYRQLISAGVPFEDARGILPLNVHCNLIAKYNLRSFVELCRARDSLRVQGEYVDIVRKMRESVLSVWPWAVSFFELPNSKAVHLIEEAAIQMKQEGAASGLVAQLAKAADLLKKS